MGGAVGGDQGGGKLGSRAVEVWQEFGDQVPEAGPGT